MSPGDLTQLMMGRIDRDAMRTNEAVFKDVWANKFFAVEEYAARAAEKALELHLDDPGKRKRLLDVGCGFGYLVVAAECLGHTAVGLDIPHPCTAAVAVAMGFRLVSHQIHRFELLPQELTDFDLITMTGVNLFERQNGKALDNLTINQDPSLPPEGWWREPEYRFLIRDLWERLRPGGQVFIEFNRGPENNWLSTVRWDQPHAKNNDNRIQIFRE
jgi:SAM-dependent methyltransferase